MALQNNYKAIIDYTMYYDSNRSVCIKQIVVGRARDCSEALRRIQEKFAPGPNDKCTVRSIEYLGWETF